MSGLPATGIADGATLAALGLGAERAGGDRPESAPAGPIAARPSAAAADAPAASAPVDSAPVDSAPIPSAPAASTPVAPDATPLSARSATVMAQTGLNVRDMPAGTVVSWLSYNQTVQLTGDRQPAGRHHWVKLAQGGWVSEEYLKLGDAAPGGHLPEKNPPQNSSVSPVPGASAGTGRVSAQTGLIVRSAPGGSVIGSLLNGQRVQVKGNRQLANGRYWVQLAEGGWVAADYVALN